MNRFQSMDLFCQVAESGSFAEVSRVSNIASSSISKQVTELEDSLGVRLFDRSTRHVRLTEIGRLYYENCRRILSEIANTEAHISDYQREPRGQISLAAPMSFGLLHLVDRLPIFSAKYPDIDINLNMDDRFVDIVNGGYDLVIRVSDFADSSLIARRLAPCKHVICASPEYLDRRGEPKTFNELVNHNCLTYNNLNTAKEWRVTQEDEIISIRLRGNIAANNGEAIRKLALQGVGIALLPTFIVGPELKAGTLVPILSDYGLRELSIYVLYPHNRHVPLKIRVFVDFLVEIFAGTPPWD